MRCRRSGIGPVSRSFRAASLILLAWAGSRALALPAADDAMTELDRYAVTAAEEGAEVEATLRRGLEAVEAEEKRVAAGADTPEARDERARLAFLRGELYRRAARAGGDEAAGAWRDEAAEAFRRMRVTFSDRRAGLLGYVGQARVERERGRLDEAAAALGPLLRMYDNPARGPGPELYRVARLEELEQELLRDPKRAVAAAEAARRSRDFADAPAVAASLDWVWARALAASAGDDRAKLEAAAAALRERAVIDAASAFERLAAIAAVDARAGGGILLPDERLAHATLLASAGFGAKAITMTEPLFGDAGLAPEQRVAVAGIAARSGDPALAVEQYGAALRDLTPGDSRLAALRGRAAALQAVGRTGAATPGDAEVRRALDELVAEEPDPRRKAAALRWRLNLVPDDDAAGVVSLLGAHPDATGADPHLDLALQTAAWRVALGAADPQQAAAAIRAAVERLALIEQAAEAAGEEAIWRATRLQRARMLGGPRLEDAHGALALLDGSKARFEGSPQQADAMRLELSLLLRLGLVTEAVAAWDRLPPDGPRDAQAAIDLAGALAQSGDPAWKGRVVELVNLSLREQVHDRGAYVAAAQAGVDAMIRVGATSDAAALMGRLRSVSGDLPDAQREALALVEAELMLAEGRIDDAIGVIDSGIEAVPSSAALHALLGRARSAAQEWPAAAAAYRVAREHDEAGSAAWWTATLGLARSLREAGDPDGSARLLRSAVALYQPPRDRTLRDAIDEERRRLEPAAPPP